MRSLTSGIYTYSEDWLESYELLRGVWRWKGTIARFWSGGIPVRLFVTLHRLDMAFVSREVPTVRLNFKYRKLSHCSLLQHSRFLVFYKSP